MDTETSETTEIRITLSNSDIERLSALAARQGISTVDLIHRAIDTMITSEATAAADWQALGLSTFEASWDNADDAVYDDWREHYGLESR
jgi:hypothetical protein